MLKLRLMNNGKWFFSIVIIWLLLFSGFVGFNIISNEVQAAGPTNVSGIISTNTTWTVTNSPYIVKGNILVNENITLTINPGVTVKFDQDKYLMVDGILSAKGTKSQMIIFTSNKATPSPGDWSCIRFTDKSDDLKCIIENCYVKYAEFGIYCKESSPKINNNIISNNSNYGIVCPGGFPKISNNTISKMGGSGISVTNVDSIYINITDNHIYNFSGYGIRIEQVDSSNVRIYNNKISNLKCANNQGGIRIDDSISSFLIYENLFYKINAGESSSNQGAGINIENDIGLTTIENNTFDNNGYGMRLTPSSASDKMIIKNNLIFNNTIGLWDGSNSYSLISKNLIYNNTEIGLKISETSVVTNNTITRNKFGITNHGLNSIFNYNNIENNSDYYFQREFKFDIDATNNYWGTNNSTIISNRIYDYFDDFNLGKVNFEPFLTKPNLNAPKYKYNPLPIAKAGPDQNVTVNQIVLFDGSNSYDLTNDALTYKWDFGDGMATDWQINCNTSHSYSQAGNYTVTLTVSDGELTDFDACIVYVSPSPINKYLTFHPMPTITLYEDDHPQDNAIDLWNYVENEKVPKNHLNFTIIGNTNPDCGVTLDSNRYLDITLAMNWYGTSVITIQVDDGYFTAIQNLTIIVNPVNDLPLADAGPDQNTTVNQIVYFDGSGSYDIESEYLTYKWDFGDGYYTEWLNNSDTSHSYTKVGIYTVTLTVREVTHPPQLTGNDTCIIRVLDSDVNHPPIADAGPDQNITEGQKVTLDGNGSYDPDGDILTYRWVTSLDVTLGLSKILKNIVFNEGIHKIELVVSDGEFSSTDECVIRVFNISGNLPPVAKINALDKLKLDDITRLSGTDSYDEDGYITSYHWDFGDGIESDWANVSIIDHKWNFPGIYTITLLVMDNDGAVGSTIHKITIVQSNGDDTGNDTDTDGDGLPNAWEIQYGLDPYDPSDANIDTDGDYLTNLDEYILGTDPIKFDSDGDGVVDNVDAFPTDPAASIDSDGDKYPDSWNPGMSEDDSTTGLKLDAYPHDPKRHEKETTDSNYLFITILIICIIIILLILASVKLFVLKSKRQQEAKSYTDDEMLSSVKHKILKDETSPELEYSHNEIEGLLEKKLKTGQISESTYHLIKSEVLCSEEAPVNKLNNPNLEGKD